MAMIFKISFLTIVIVLNLFRVTLVLDAHGPKELIVFVMKE